MQRTTKHHMRVQLVSDNGEVVANRLFDVRVPLGGAVESNDRDLVAAGIVANFVAEHVYDCIARGVGFAVTSELVWITGPDEDFDNRERTESATWSRRASEFAPTL